MFWLRFVEHWYLHNQESDRLNDTTLDFCCLFYQRHGVPVGSFIYEHGYSIRNRERYFHFFD
jgi:hypothetical protein